MKVDLFYFFNEYEVAEVRFNILDQYVDKFIVVEFSETFSGVPKRIRFNKNSIMFSKWAHKIEHYVVDDFPIDQTILDMAYKSPCTGNHEHYWIREFYLKESARKALKGLNDDDIVFISDLDEIWNYKLNFNPKGDEVIKPKQLPYLYYFNQRSTEDWLGWSGTICTRYETIKNGIINHLRNDDMQKFTVLENGGWHFNSIGGKERKIKDSKHPIISSKSDWDRREVGLHIDEKDLPEYLIQNKDLWKKHFL